MDCHNIQLLINDFIEEKLTDSQLEIFLEHISGCKDCYDELEVYYMITSGLKQLEEEHDQTLDLKKELQAFISAQQLALNNRKRAIVRKKQTRALFAVGILFSCIFVWQIFLTSEEEIHSIHDFQSAAGKSIQGFWPVNSNSAAVSDITVQTGEYVVRRMNFENDHPVIPEYVTILNMNFEIEEPDSMNILEKDRWNNG